MRNLRQNLSRHRVAAVALPKITEPRRKTLLSRQRKKAAGVAVDGAAVPTWSFLEWTFAQSRCATVFWRATNAGHVQPKEAMITAFVLLGKCKAAGVEA
jgi:hypothetical protein